MARFKISARSKTPLRVQLATPANVIASVQGIGAYGENAVGRASRPVITRPSTAGKGKGVILSTDNSGITSQLSGITIFSTAPSYPQVNIGSFNLPMSIYVTLAPGGGIIMLPSSFLLLYAFASGGHLWSGELEFEEL